MNEFIISTKGSLWESSCPEHKGERQGSRKGGNMTGAEWILNNKYIYENGNIKLGLIQLKDIQDATDKFKQQIISEGKENYYIIAMADFGGSFTMQMLPIYGDPNKYVTKWFCSTPQGAIDSAKRDRKSVPATLLKGPVDENGNVISRQGSRKGSRKGLKYNWDGVPFEEIEYRLDSPVIDEDIYSMSDEELLQFAEDHGLRPEMFTNELPDWAQRDGSRKGSRKGAFDQAMFDWMYDNGMLSEEYEFEETLQDIKNTSNKYHMSFYDAANVYMAALDNQTTEDNAIKRNLKPRIPLTQPPRQGSRKGSRKGKRIIHYGIGDYDVSDIDRYIAEGGVPKGIINGMKNRVITYLMNEKGYSEDDAWSTYDAWATHDNLEYGIPKYEYEDTINKYREMVGLPPLEDSHKGSRKGSRKGEAGDTDQSQLFIYLYEQDTTDNNTLRNMWNSLSSDEQDYILFQFGESRQDFEESFN